MVDVTREQVLAFRVAAQNLDRARSEVSALKVLDLGIQDTPAGSARIALAARVPGEPDIDGWSSLAWTIRGAPHLHRSADLYSLSRALWPVNETDAMARLLPMKSSLVDAGLSGLDAFTATANAFRTVLSAPMTKGEASAAVTREIPASMSRWCPGCQATHVYGILFPQAALAGGVQLEPAGASVRLIPIDDWPGVPTRAEGTADLIRKYLHVLGPATAAHVAGFLGTAKTAIGKVWPDDLAEVRIDGAAAWIPESDVKALRSAATPELVRLLPALDPHLRDRELLVPDRARQKAIWRPVGSPGAVMVDGEIVGTWRAKMSGKTKLVVTVELFESLPKRAHTALAAEAEMLANLRGASTVDLVYN